MKKTKQKKRTSIEERKRITFHVRTMPGSDVYLSGSFNKWNGKAKKMKDPSGNGEYSVTVTLPLGEHEYKFVINGEWYVDHSCPKWVLNDCGTLNSVVTVA